MLIPSAVVALADGDVVAIAEGELQEEVDS